MVFAMCSGRFPRFADRKLGLQSARTGGQHGGHPDRQFRCPRGRRTVQALEDRRRVSIDCLGTRHSAQAAGITCGYCPCPKSRTSRTACADQPTERYLQLDGSSVGDWVKFLFRRLPNAPAVNFIGLFSRGGRGRIGMIGVCGWGGKALNRVAVDKRVKAVVASTMY